MWTKEAVHEFVETRLQGHPLIVVANREPYIHRFAGEHIECILPASGMATALDPILRACAGTWVAHGGGDADRETVDAHDRIRVPPDDPSYTLRRVWLTKEEEDGYYFGLSNEALWPLCHVVFTRPVFDPRHWAIYRDVNEKFARAVLEEAAGRPAFVFIQDYHFALLPRLLKQENPQLIVAQFWHIPWPNRETFRAFPWKEELLEGLLGNDLMGFHLRYHCQNFLDTVDRLLEARVDMERSEITRGGKLTVVRPFPISIDYEKHVALARSAAADAAVARWRKELRLRNQLVGIGIDRIDYTKGIPDRLRAIDLLLDRHPEYRGRLAFVQIGVPSRTHIPHYQQLDDEIDSLVEHVNWRWGTAAWRPIIYLKQHYGQLQLAALHRLADFCVVNSLHDGMNLVAKEFVSSRFDEGGVLILSNFTGAARELTDALIVNPFSIEELAEAMHQALEMPAAQRQKRMQKMRAAVEGNDIYRWAGKILSALLKFEVPEDAAPYPEEVVA
jgi:trehalose 6-phosphate synthase